MSHVHHFDPASFGVQGFELQFTGIVEWRCECGEIKYTRADVPNDDTGRAWMGHWKVEARA